MNDCADEAIARIQRAFSSERGPAEYRLDESGHFYEAEGREIAQALLDLDPLDIQVDDLMMHSSFLPGWSTDSGLRWLIPGIVRIAFEEADGEWILMTLFDELERRATQDGMRLSEDEGRSILDAHQAFYSTEEHKWNVVAHDAPFIARLRMTTSRSTTSPRGGEAHGGEA